MRRALRAFRFASLAAAFSATLVAPIADAGAHTSRVEFLYVDANEDTASGGHVALRLGDQTYHFGYHPPGLLLLDREDSGWFEHVYTGLENRSIESRPIAVSAETFELLRASFNERYLAELAEREEIDALAADRQLLETWRKGAAAIPVRAAGYFVAPEEAAGEAWDRDRSVARIARSAPCEPQFARSEPESARSETQPARGERESVRGDSAGCEARSDPCEASRAPDDTRPDSPSERSAARAARLASGAAPSPPCAAAPLARLRDRVHARYGAAYLERRIEAATETIRRLARAPADAEPGIAARVGDASEEIEALRALAAAAPLRADAIVAPAADEPAPSAAERRALAALAERLEGELLDLVGSRRRDAGWALLVGMARLLVLDDSLRSGRLLVLDTWPAEARALTREEIEARGGRIEELATIRRVDLDHARAALFATARPREADWAVLEEAANRFRDLARAGEGGAVRASAERLLPVRPALRSLPAEARPDPALAVAAIERLGRAEAARRDRLRAKHDYELVGRNCVSEIFVEIDRALVRAAAPDAPVEGAEESAREESEDRHVVMDRLAGEGSVVEPAVDRDLVKRLAVEPTVDPDLVERLAVERLGGHVPPNRGLEFIPFVAAAAVGRELRVDGVERAPSYRRARVATMIESEGIGAAIRESNVLTSTVYRRNQSDSAFLFFTDDVLLARPLFGAANLAVGAGASALGLALAPFDGGDMAWAGVRGMLWSVPELAFVNVRKGSFFAVPPAGGA